MKLSPDQDTALQEALMFLLDDNPDNNEMSISGPAGTGKTVLTKFLLRAARAQVKQLQFLTGVDDQLTVHLTSTTNKAARVLSDATGEKAGTIHSLLGLRVWDDYETGKTVLKKSGKSKIIHKAIIIIDEGSMANKMLLEEIRESTYRCKVIYIGDSYQLAPVYENVCPVFTEVKNQAHLTTIQRQAAGSPIIQFANEFRNALDTGVFPEIKSHGSDILLLDGKDFQYHVDKQFTRAPHVDHARMLAWTNDKVHEYNAYLRGLNVNQKDYQVGEYLLTNTPIVEQTGFVLYSTDAVGRITDIEPDILEDIEGFNIELDNKVTVFQAKNQSLVVKLIKRLTREAKKTGNWYPYFQAKDAFADLRPVHACTVNKAQGSTYKHTFIDLDDIGRNTKNNEIARLMYTAITRASDRVYMYGELPRRLYV